MNASCVCQTNGLHDRDTLSSSTVTSQCPPPRVPAPPPRPSTAFGVRLPTDGKGTSRSVYSEFRPIVGAWSASDTLKPPNFSVPK